MTLSDDFIPGDPNYDPGPSYPVVFGVTLTPIVSGVLLGLLGLAGMVYLLLNFVQPEWDKYQQLDAQVKDKQSQIEQSQATLQQRAKVQAELDAAKKQQREVLSLFANESSLNTVLLDINRQIEARNAGVAATRRAKLAACPANIRANIDDVEKQVGDLAAKAQLTKFEPVVDKSGIINDGSYGPLVNGKLKRQTVNVELQGNFNQVQSILRSVERLQPLLVLKNTEFKIGDQNRAKLNTIYSLQGNVYRPAPGCQPEQVITTSFQMEALLPLTAAEKAAAAPTPPAQQK